jgi:penicillin-binding protein A
MNMNRAITRLFMVAILIIAVLIAWTSRWTVFSAQTLDNNSLNKLGFYESLKIKRGDIYAADGKVLAKSTKARGDTWGRTYPEGSLFAQPIGYLIPEDPGSSAGLEQYRASELRGKKSGLQSIFGDFSSGKQVGNNVYTYLDPTAQKQAQSLLDQDRSLNGGVGSVVAIVPQTGAVKVMYSNPTYDDNDPNKYFQKSVCDNGASTCNGADKIGAMVNSATQEGLPPGSTFKVVTTAAALNTGKYTPNSIVNGPSPLSVSGVPLHNDGNESYHDITLTDALTNSVNTVYAQVGLHLGAKVMQDYMKRFGFYKLPPLDYPSSQMIASGERDGVTGKLLLPTRPCLTGHPDACVDLGRMSIGQDKMSVTPLQMAMVASTVADNGTLMTPRLSYKAVNQDGLTVARWPAKVYHHVTTPAVAKQMQQMMTDVVEEGTGETVKFSGISVAGKTGTASTGGCTTGTFESADSVCTDGGQPYDDAWFIGFAPASDPKIAVAVELDDIPNGYGGTYAAPIAASIMKTLLSEGQ